MIYLTWLVMLAVVLVTLFIVFFRDPNLPRKPRDH